MVRFCIRRVIAFLAIFSSTFLVTQLVLKDQLLFQGKNSNSSSGGFTWTSLDLYNLTPDLEAEFLAYKESQYLARAQRIKNVCKHVQQLGVHISAKSLLCKSGTLKTLRHFYAYQNDSLQAEIQNCLFLIDLDDGLGFCRVPKVASSTWLMRFKMLKSKSNKVDHNKANWTEKDNFWLHLDARTWWPESSSSYANFTNSVLSFVFLRDPLDRLVSAYHDKMVRSALKGLMPWPQKAKDIVNRYRKDALGWISLSGRVPTPSEFVRHVIDSVRRAKSLFHIDEHWRPQSSCCPLCSTQFQVYGRYEDIGEDTAYIAIKSGKKKFFADQQDLKVNDSDDYNKKRKKSFWQHVDPKLVNILRNEIYKIDYEFYGQS